MNYKTIDLDRPTTNRTTALRSHKLSKVNNDDKIMDQINLLKLSIKGNSKIENKQSNLKLKSSHISETTRNKINQLYNMTIDTGVNSSISPIKINKVKQQLKTSQPIISLKKVDFKDHVKNIEVIKRMQRRITKDN